jgi:hypothetical protein
MKETEIEQEMREHPWATEEQAQQIVKEHMAATPEDFDDLKYTRRKIVQELGAIQEHATDGSAFQNCKCIEEKHLNMLSKYATEGVAIASDPKEKEFYAWLSPWADKTLDHVLQILETNNEPLELSMWALLGDDCREIRHEITEETFNVPNPASTRAYLPRGLTKTEKEDSKLRSLLSRCIRKVEIRCCGGPTSDYSKCKCNPIAICRSSIEK